MIVTAGGVTPREAARRLGVHVETVRRWVRDGRVPCVLRTPTGRIRIHLDVIDSLLRSRQHEQG